MHKTAFALDSGLNENGVIQRDPSNLTDVFVCGHSAHLGLVEARILEGKNTLKDWQRIAEVTPQSGETWRGHLRGLPTGGPFAVEFRVGQSDKPVFGGCTIKNVFVGDLWILGGQSNMEGHGHLKGVELEPEKPHRWVKNFTHAEHWETAEEPLHWLIDSPNPVHWSCQPEERLALAKAARVTRRTGCGLALTFAKELVKRFKVPIGLIPCAHGGTSMEQWSPAKKSEGGKSLYGSMLLRISKATATPFQNDGTLDVSRKVRGMLWYQGESDANEAAAAAFKEKFLAFIQALRSDLHAPELPFFYCQLGRFIVKDFAALPWNQVQSAQLACETALPGLAMTAAIDLPLADCIHIGTNGLKILGKRFAALAARHVYAGTGGSNGPRLAEAWFDSAERRYIRLKFKGVHGRLLAPRRLDGFVALSASNEYLPLVFDAIVVTPSKDTPPEEAIVRVRLTDAALKGSKLWYGYGLNPFCTLVDERDRPVPVFGPLELDALPVAE